jgi:vacuolar-type H+-ATPase subunit I/STV1|tara:strand:- start:299 stop:874 length:576 start_codon:yes stop_codon:yes gene_type:complete
MLRDNDAEFKKMFQNEHSTNNRKIQSLELKTWAIFTMGRLTSHQIGEFEKNTKLRIKLEKTKKLDNDEVNYFIKCLDSMQEQLQKLNQLRISNIENISTQNIGNKEIISRIKQELLNNKKLNYEDSRYVQFCMLELQKQEIFESGIVPDGWLPSDDKTNQKINELSDSIDKKYKKKLNRGGQMVDDLIKMG